MLGLSVKKKGEMLIIKQGLYKSLQVPPSQIKGAHVDRRALGAWCLVVDTGSKTYRFKASSKGQAHRALEKLFALSTPMTVQQIERDFMIH